MSQQERIAQTAGTPSPALGDMRYVVVGFTALAGWLAFRRRD